MKKILAGTIFLLSFYGFQVFSQTNEGAKEEAFKDLSVLTGVKIANNEQAKEICNVEKYLVSCAEIGKKHNLFDASEKKQVDAVLVEFKGRLVENLKSCASEDCLLEVANQIASSFNKKNPSLAQSLDLTPKKVGEKKNIAIVVKEAGVTLNDCRAIDSDNAPIELLRACVKLSKNDSVKQYVSDMGTTRSQSLGGNFGLAEAFKNGEYTCGNNTVDGCGSFCLKPVAGATEVPPVCREIANKFFGSQGLKQLETAYTQAQQSSQVRASKSENLVFTTPTGETIVNPQSIGNYIEAQAKNGNSEAVGKGMDFMIAHGFVNKEDKILALDFVKKVKESNGLLDLDACSRNPENCKQYISKEQNSDIDIKKEISRVFNEEATKLGVVNALSCVSGGQFTEECLVAAEAALPRMVAFVNDHPEADKLVRQMKERIIGANQSLLARKQTETKLSSGENIIIGDMIFKKFEDIQTYCAKNGQECLTEAARKGFISKDFAAQKYEQSVDAQRNYVNQQPTPYVNNAPAVPLQNYLGLPAKSDAVGSFNKEEALKNFQSWLDNPQGPPPIPGYFVPLPPPPIKNFVPQQTSCPNLTPKPCEQGFYRQEFRDVNNCKNYSDECIAIPGYKVPVPVLAPAVEPVLGKLPIQPSVVPEIAQPSVVPNQNPSVVQCDWNTQYLKASKNICLPRTGCVYSGDPEYNSAECNVIRTSAVWLNSSAPAGQRQLLWNAFGLKSWVLTSASEERIAKLKADCANVPANANVWMQGAGDSTTIDFGMPDSAKCKTVTPLPMAPTPTTAIMPATPTTPATSVVVPAVSTTVTAPVISTSTCTPELITLLGSGCHNMGNAFFDANMTKWVVPPATVASSCSTSYLQNCSTGSVGSQGQACPVSQYWNGTACVASPAGTACPAGQYWNNGVCVATGTATGAYSSCPANIVTLLGDGCHAMTEAYFNGPMSRYVRFNSTAVTECSATSISGCPGASYVAPASSCTSGQYWNGSACIENPVGSSTGGGSSVSSCPANIVALLGDGCHAMTEAYFNGPMSRYVRFNSTAVTECSATSISGCPGASYVAPASSCTSGQYWNGSACVTSPTNTACPAGQYWSGATCVSSTPSSSCSGSQYWNGSACITSPVPTTCATGEFWNGSACVSSAGAVTSACSSGQYWNGTACVASPVITACPAGQYWSGAACVASTPTPPPANLLEALLPLSRFWQNLFGWLR